MSIDRFVFEQAPDAIFRINAQGCVQLQRLRDLLDVSEEIAKIGHWRLQLREAVHRCSEFGTPYAITLSIRRDDGSTGTARVYDAPDEIQPTLDWWREQLHPDDAPAMQEAIERAISGAQDETMPIDLCARIPLLPCTGRRVPCRRATLDAVRP